MSRAFCETWGFHSAQAVGNQPGRARVQRVRKKVVLHLILGGAAVHRCGKYAVLNTASAAEVCPLKILRHPDRTRSASDCAVEGPAVRPAFLHSPTAAKRRNNAAHCASRGTRRT